MQIKKIKDVEYQQYLDSIEYAGFLQSVEASKKMESNGWKIEYLQFVENNTVVASGMIGMIPLLKIFMCQEALSWIIMIKHLLKG